MLLLHVSGLYERHLQGAQESSYSPETRRSNIDILNTVEPRFTNAPVHEQIFLAKNVSDYERCLGLRNASWQQRQAESIGAGVSVAG
jgi:hypothetical protein